MWHVMHWLDGIERVKSCWIGWPGSRLRNRRIAWCRSALVAERRVLRRSAPAIGRWRRHVAGRAAAAAIVAGLIVGAGKRQQRIEQARLLQAEEHGIGAQLRAEAAIAQFASGRPGSSSRAGLPISPFRRPPRSNTRSTLPGCETSQRWSGSRNGSTPFVRVSSAVGGGDVSSRCGVPSRAVAFAEARVLLRDRAVVVERGAPQHRAVRHHAGADVLHLRGVARCRTRGRRRADRPG